MTEPELPPEEQPYAEAVPPPWMADATPEELAAYGTEENPWPAPPDTVGA